MNASLRDLIPGIPEEEWAALRKMWGGEIPQRWGLGERPAVLVIDMTEGFVRDEYPTGWGATGEPCAAAIARLLQAARPAGLPVFYTVTEALLAEPQVGGWLRGTPGPSMFPFSGPAQAHQVVPEVKPEPDDVVFPKPKPSAFYATQLAGMLTYLRVDSVIVTGMTTSGCVRATVNDAFMRNYRVTVPVECVADRSQLSHRVELFDMGVKYADIVATGELIDDLRAR